MTKKIKILTISDHPLSPSGVGTQTKYFILSLLNTGKFQFFSLGGAVKHDNYDPVQTEEFKEDWMIQPVDGYGNPDVIRSVLRTYRPDMVWFMTDPRFFGWLWEMENEIRSLCPMIYYHVWDNYPYPTYNKNWYDSTDAVVTISKVTSDIVQTVSPQVDEYYVPHAVPPEIFHKRPDDIISKFRKDTLGVSDDCFVVFWTNRNARRKQSGSLLFWYKKFLDKLEEKYGHRNSLLFMHTEPKDPNGQDLYVIADNLRLNDQRHILFSKEKVSPEDLSLLYSAADTCISVSDAEGFGLYTFESLACGTPIIATMTGGMQEQVTNLSSVSEEIMNQRNKQNRGSFTEYEFGIGLEPASKAIIGSQEVPFIYEDRLCEKQVVDSLMCMYEYGKEKRTELGAAGAHHIQNNYSFAQYGDRWEKIMLEVHNKCGSWETRKNYKNWELITI